MKETNRPIDDSSQKNKFTTKDVQRAKNDLIKLGKIYDLFSKVKRVPRYSNGERENDPGHSFHLALSACEIAMEYYSDLDSGLVTQFSLVHDLVEVYAGDTPTMNITDDGRLKKEQIEKEATEKLLSTLPKHTAELLKRYENQIEPEARFVRYIDKVMPGIINIINKEVSTFLKDNNVKNLEQFNKIVSENQKRFENIFPELPFISNLMKSIETDLREEFFEN